ncbi:6-phosphogluconate dehydrogenase [Phaeosphaeriaceae sp. PMI808]|nr:6-phosphogluconate dehydrogenase [Phaeosphaeriaceae sp. PMI808]
MSTIAIKSIGQMGLGMANLLIAHNYRVITNVSGRSQATQSRAASAGIELVSTDAALYEAADYILSIVPPRDAVATAQGIEAVSSEKKIFYLDLNAISPNTARSIGASFAANAPSVTLVDGGIIGGPPAQNGIEWTKPGLPLSGPFKLPDEKLAEILNVRYVGSDVGMASGLKCCFAALSKGFTALALQSFTTAQKLGVYDDLQDYLNGYNAAAGNKARKSVVGCTTKAYRWVEEMNQIGECFSSEGGWKEQATVFREIANVFQGLADVVEQEGTDKMGNTEGVVSVLGKGLARSSCK